MVVLGYISAEIINTLGLDLSPGAPIYIGESNIRHMKKSHPEDYKRYRHLLKEILNDPDYVGINPSDQSIEFVKEIQMGDEFIKVAVRVSQNGKHYARTLYKLNTRRTLNFIRDGKLLKIDRKH
ncbi:PBECR3 domain-containing polyvalent protein [Eubacterium sp.]|uniref:PBECR3 domain-containing polyvalent protein n=1 Tax=Eubacterium sp. TaxID=142586 RepID=UPI002FC7E003